MRGFLHGSRIIWQERGIRGFFQGFVPTTARQAANSATRFTAYTTLKQFAEGYVAPGEKLGTLSTFAIGGIAGIITVYVPTIVSISLSTSTPLPLAKTNLTALQLHNPTARYRQNKDAIDRSQQELQE